MKDNLMKTSILILISFLFISLIIPISVEAVEVADYSAAIISIKGNVLIQRYMRRTRAVAHLGMEVKTGDRLIVGKNSSASIYYYSGNLKIVEGEKTLRILAQEVASGRDPDVIKPNIFFTKPARVFSSVGRSESVRNEILSGIPDIEKKNFSLISPSFITIRPHPIFTWDTINETSEEIILTLENDKSEKLFSEDVTGKNCVRYPSDKATLKPGVTYYWYIRIKSCPRENVSNIRSFNLAGEKVMSRMYNMLKLLKQNGADECTRMMMLGYYQKSRKLYVPAVESFEKLAQLHPDEKLPHQELLLLYYILGDIKNFEREKEIITRKKTLHD
ncbi:MAG: hypothetical protein K8T10_06785 [Candidatus Eremiobacteraeota bacterium]|nr:hypothetical protein [Candidatus Eremiobacteraeota bacterium]